MSTNPLQDKLDDELLPILRSVGSDTQYIEVKDGKGGFPASLLKSISAFANDTGGTLILGLAEPDFAPTGIDTKPLMQQLIDKCRENFEPAIYLKPEICFVNEQEVIVADVPELTNMLKPCAVKESGDQRRAYRRSHDGNRELTTYEHHMIHASKGQPEEDCQPVPRATLEDLDQDSVGTLLERLRSTRGAAFKNDDDTTCLKKLGVLVPFDSGLLQDDRHSKKKTMYCVSLAGLLALGSYPQQFFPGLGAVFIVHATTTGKPLKDGTRYLDYVPIEGSISNMLEMSIDVLRRNMARKGVVTGLVREDFWEYPISAIREILINAFQHRDYHKLAQGAPTKIELFPNRLVIESPGGIHGNINPEDLLLTHVTPNARNAYLTRLMRDIPRPGTDQFLCENAGFGLYNAAEELREAGMTPPIVQASLSSFNVTCAGDNILDERSLRWLSEMQSTMHGLVLSSPQRIALAYTRRHGTIDNHAYRALTGVDALTATRDMAQLGKRNVLVRSGLGRASSWSLAPRFDAREQETETQLTLDGAQQSRNAKHRIIALDKRLTDVCMALEAEPMSTREIAERFEVTRSAAKKWLSILEKKGQVCATMKNRRSPLQKWELVNADKQVV